MTLSDHGIICQFDCIPMVLSHFLIIKDFYLFHEFNKIRLFYQVV